MKLKGVVEYKDNSSHASKEVQGFITRSVSKAAFLMEKETKEVLTGLYAKRTDKQKQRYKLTGHLRRSVRANTKGMEFGSAEMQVNPVREGADTNYAIHLEYGTKYIAPWAFMRKGIGRAKKHIPKIFADEAKKVKDNVIAKRK